MPIKIVHTADNHIGKKFKSGRYSPAVQEKLIQERLDALKRIVDLGNDKEAHFLVIAGDLFDSIYVAGSDIKSGVDILKNFTGEAVLVLPGNHDFYQGSLETLWRRFIDVAGKVTDKIRVLHECRPEEFLVEDRKIVFYPGPCDSKHSDTNVIGWVKELDKAPEILHIGIAHGNVEGLGLGGDRYFNMTPADLKASQVDCWLLGHIHMPFPEREQLTHDGYFFSATHTPDGFDYKKDGYCWYFEFDENKQLSMQQVVTGKVKFIEVVQTLHQQEDIDKLYSLLGQTSSEFTALKLTLHGRLVQDELSELRVTLDKFAAKYLHLEIQDNLLLAIDQAYVEANYVPSSVPHELLTNLSNADKQLALQLAHQLLKQAAI